MVKPTNHFINRVNGQAIRVEKVTEQFANITVLRQLVSTYMMPVADYDSKFVEQYIPLDMGDIRLPDDYRMPANFEVWDAESKPKVEEPPAPDETSEGVRIGADDDSPPMSLEEAYGAIERLKR